MGFAASCSDGEFCAMTKLYFLSVVAENGRWMYSDLVAGVVAGVYFRI